MHKHKVYDLDTSFNIGGLSMPELFALTLIFYIGFTAGRQIAGIKAMIGTVIIGGAYWRFALAMKDHITTQFYYHVAYFLLQPSIFKTSRDTKNIPLVIK